MEAIAVILVFLTGVAVLGLATITWGADSRERYLDDRRH